MKIRTTILFGGHLWTVIPRGRFKIEELKLSRQGRDTLEDWATTLQGGTPSVQHPETRSEIMKKLGLTLTGKFDGINVDAIVAHHDGAGNSYC